MANIDLKAATPATSISTSGFLFGAESQSDANPKVYTVAAIQELIRDTIGAELGLTGGQIDALFIAAEGIEA